MKAAILSVGDELVLGQTVDTNSAWLSRRLAAEGCDILAHLTVGDAQSAIEGAMRELAARSDLLVVSGGIGPTADDLTRQALAAVLRVPLERNPDWEQQLRSFFSRINRPMPEANLVQAMIPRGAEMLWNTAGTAAGIRAKVGGCTVAVVPGVPKEMKAMFDRDIVPAVRSAAGGAAILSTTLHTFGLGESAVAEKLGSLMDRTRNPSVGTTVSQGIVSLRLNVRAASPEQGRAALEQTVGECRAALGPLVFGRDEQSLAAVVGVMLAEKGLTLSLAESCTGGLLAKLVTDTPGSSAYLRCGWVVYSNQAKQDQLGVTPETLEENGAVSEPVAAFLADAARQRGRTTFGIGITGIAGPDGGSADKPVGTVWISLASADRVVARRFVFSGDREMVRDRAAKTALTMLRYRLMGLPDPF